MEANGYEVVAYHVNTLPHHYRTTISWHGILLPTGVHSLMESALVTNPTISSTQMELCYIGPYYLSSRV